MNKIEEKKIYKEAVNKWGLPAQLNLLMEESAEVIVATSKVLRKDSIENWEKLAEEVADVEIMASQLKTVVTWQCFKEKVAYFKKQKLLRLKERVGDKIERDN